MCGAVTTALAGGGRPPDSDSGGELGHEFILAVGVFWEKDGKAALLRDSYARCGSGSTWKGDAEGVVVSEGVVNHTSVADWSGLPSSGVPVGGEDSMGKIFAFAEIPNHAVDAAGVAHHDLDVAPLLQRGKELEQPRFILGGEVLCATASHKNPWHKAPSRLPWLAPHKPPGIVGTLRPGVNT